MRSLHLLRNFPMHYSCTSPRTACFLWRRISSVDGRNVASSSSSSGAIKHALAEFWTITGKSTLPSKSTKATYDIVRPGNVSGPRKVPECIVLPSYARSAGGRSGYHDDDVPVQATSNTRRRLEPRRRIDIKNQDEVDRMKEAGKLGRKMLNIAVQHAKIGVTTDEIDAVVHEAIVNHDAYPSPLLYRGFPKSICTSVNNVVCHGIPDDRPLKDGDIISIDITVYLNGYHGDCAETVAVGTVDEGCLRLIEAARICRDEAIKACGPGKPFSNIGATISTLLNSLGFKVIPTFCGHGIGSYFHGPPDILHFANHGSGKMETGMTFTIEPVISEGKERVVILDDGWTAVTVDHSRAAQFEHTILISDTGVEILTT